MSIEFLVTAIIIIAAPGTGALYTLAAGLAHGPRAALLAAFASTLGIIPHLLAAILGLAAIIHTSSLAFTTIKYAGVIWLVRMAWQMFFAGGAFAPSPDQRRKSILAVLRDGVVMNLLNPKLSIFFFAFLPQFISTNTASPVNAMLGLGLIFMLMTFVVFAIYGFVAGLVRHQVLSRPKVLTWIMRGFGATFAAMATKLAISD